MAGQESHAIEARMSIDLPFVLIAVFASVALGVGAIVSFALTWSTAGAARDSAALSARRRHSRATAVGGGAESVDQTVPAGRAEVSEGHVASAAPAGDGRAIAA